MTPLVVSSPPAPERCCDDLLMVALSFCPAQPLDRDQPNGRAQWRFTVFAQDEGGEGLVGYTDVQVNLKDINDNNPAFPQGVYFGNVTENGTAGKNCGRRAATCPRAPQRVGFIRLSYFHWSLMDGRVTGLTLPTQLFVVVFCALRFRS